MLLFLYLSNKHFIETYGHLLLTFSVVLFWWLDDLTRSTIGSSSDSEKMIQRLNDELQEAQELADSEKHKCRELQGNIKTHTESHPSDQCSQSKLHR